MTDQQASELATVETIRASAEELRARVVEAARQTQRSVTIVAVTKAFAPELAVRAAAAGLGDLGENYAKELAEKASMVRAEGFDPRWHFIGGLQRNKVKTVAGDVSLWQSVDRVSLIGEIAKRAAGSEILIQVNTTGEPQKSGCEPGEAAALVEHGRELGLDVRGLMTVGPTSAAIDPRPAFAELRALAERCEVEQLSMGMSGDFEAAIAEGATIIRVGSVLFGPRPPKAVR